MKKIGFLILLICFISGCESKECPKCEECKSCEAFEESSITNEELTAHEKELKELLLKYGQEVFAKPEYTSGLDVNIIYSVSLNSLKEIYGYDTSKFVNEKTQNPCDDEYTAVEMIIKEQKKDGTYDYQLRAIIRCYEKNLID